MLKIKHSKIKYVTLLICALSLLKSFSINSQTSPKDSLYKKIKILKSKPNFQKDTIYINLLYELGQSIKFYNRDSLLLVSKETTRLSKAINYFKGEIKGLINLGIYNSEIGKQDQALQIFLNAHEKALQIEDLELILNTKYLIALEYEYKEDYAKALNESLKGIEVAKKSSDYNWLSTFYVNTSYLYNSQKEYKQSILFLTKAKELSKKGVDDKTIAITLANLTSTYIKTGDLKNASLNIEQCITIFKNLGLDLWLAYAYEIKASIYLEQKHYTKALSWFQKSSDIHEEIEQTRYKIPLYTGMAKTYIGLQNYQLAEAYGLKSLKLSRELNDLNGEEENLKTLYNLKKITNNSVEALTYLEEFKNVSDTIYKNKNKKDLKILKSNLEFNQEKERYLTENNKKITQQKYYFYGALLVILAFLVIIFILKKNNSIQYELNQELTKTTSELKKKENHLNNSNNTKSRLFSIIAHDLKGPISSFKSMFSLVGSGGISTEDFMSFAPKMGEDIDSISFTLNNLLSWGQTQMDGIVTKLDATNIQELVTENSTLLSKTASQKSIDIVSQITPNVITWSDKNQISIVIRNLTSNALKFTPENGTITIGANEIEKYWEIWIKDTGIGLSEEAINKIFNKNETFTTYGTNNEKGTGLGLVLCKEMVENNDGEIWVESVLGKGTCFYFTVPKYNEAHYNG